MVLSSYPEGVNVDEGVSPFNKVASHHDSLQTDHLLPTSLRKHLNSVPENVADFKPSAAQQAEYIKNTGENLIEQRNKRRKSMRFSQNIVQLSKDTHDFLLNNGPGIGTSKAVQALKVLRQNKKDAEIQGNGLGLLRTIAHILRSDELMNLGIAPAVVDSLRNLPLERRVQRLACEIISQLCTDDKNARALMKLGAGPLIVQALITHTRNQDMNGLEQALYALYNITFGEELRKLVLLGTPGVGVADALVSAMKVSGRNPTILTECFVQIENFHLKGREEFVSNDVALIILKAMRAHNYHDELVKYGCKALRIIFGSVLSKSYGNTFNAELIAAELANIVEMQLENTLEIIYTLLMTIDKYVTNQAFSYYRQDELNVLKKNLSSVKVGRGKQQKQLRNYIKSLQKKISKVTIMKA